LEEEKSKHVGGFGSEKWFWLSMCAQFAEAGKRTQQSITPADDDWLDS
jgi:hypothetical protein